MLDFQILRTRLNGAQSKVIFEISSVLGKSYDYMTARSTLQPKFICDSPCISLNK